MFGIVDQGFVTCDVHVRLIFRYDRLNLAIVSNLSDVFFALSYTYLAFWIVN